MSNNFDISIRLTPELYASLTPRDIVRLWPKLNMVIAIATDMAEAMLKGNRKYPSDEHTAKEWMNYHIEDLTDSLLYAHFLKRKIVLDYENGTPPRPYGTPPRPYGTQDEADSEARDEARSET